MSQQGVPIEESARLASHATTVTTQRVYGKELRPIITTGATAIDPNFRQDQTAQRSAQTAQDAGTLPCKSPASVCAISS